MPKASKNTTAAAEEISVLPISQGTVSFAVLGTSPLIFNRMAEKARRELLMPKGRKTSAERAVSLKHDPLAEYRASVYRREGSNGPTRLLMPAPCFKGSMMTAALDLPGTRKSEIGRLVWVDGVSVDLYGVPQMLMSVVRSADINKTPDIRTRAIVPEWACVIKVHFVQPKLNATAIANLLAAGGILAGVGDFRQEKGKGSFGQFQMTTEKDPNFKRIIQKGGMAAQDAALAEPEFYDPETEELYSWFVDAVKAKGAKTGQSEEIDEGELQEAAAA